MQHTEASSTPELGFLRLTEIVGDRKRGIPALIPVSKSTWWAKCKAGEWPAPVKLSANVTAWRRADVLALAEKLGEGRA